ncbi:MAG: nucleotidyltransferase domain-containing protein [Chloroflexota bacterium]
MDVGSAFDEYQVEVNADPAQLEEARRRRDLFKKAFGAEPDVKRTFPSGSLARGTMLEPIHDVDFVVVYNADDHRDWGSPGSSAGDALGYVSGRVNTLLGATNGTVAKEVRLASPRNHAVKCFLDDPAVDDAFTVDVMPALQQEDGPLLIPEISSADWIPADPEDLIDRIAARHARWNRFVPVVRQLKYWNREVAKAGMKSLVVEVLAHDCIPDIYESDLGEQRPDALSRFFTAAALAVEQPVCDPAGLCGEIQPDLDVDLTKRKLQEAADGAYLALAAERRGDVNAAICQWRKVFGSQFPEPPGGCSKSSGVKPAVAVAPRLIRDTPQGR